MRKEDGCNLRRNNRTARENGAGPNAKAQGPALFALLACGGSHKTRQPAKRGRQPRGRIAGFGTAISRRAGRKGQQIPRGKQDLGCLPAINKGGAEGCLGRRNGWPAGKAHERRRPGAIPQGPQGKTRPVCIRKNGGPFSARRAPKKLFVDGFNAKPRRFLHALADYRQGLRRMAFPIGYLADDAQRCFRAV